LELTDLVLLDIKHIDPIWHKKITWQENDSVLRFLEYLESQNKRTWIRYVLVPWYSDQEEYIAMIWQKYWQYKCIERLEILPYHRLWEYKWKELWWKYELENIVPPTPKQVDDVKSIFEKYFKKVVIR